MNSLNRIGIIRQSVSVFLYGITGLVPIAGIFHATHALVKGFRLQQAYSEPNPVDHYRKWGMALGLFGILISICGIIFIAFVLISARRQNPPDGIIYID